MLFRSLDQILEKTANKNLVQTNKEKYLLLTQGVLVSFQNQNGELVKKRLKVFNFEKSPPSVGIFFDLLIWIK